MNLDSVEDAPETTAVDDTAPNAPETEAASEDRNSAPPEAPAEPETPVWIRPVNKSVKVVLTNRERLALGDEQAQLYADLEAVEKDQKNYAANCAAKRKTLAARISEISLTMRTGFVFKPVDCEVHFNVPRAGKKTTIRLDTRDVVDVDDMLASEMQPSLFAQNGTEFLDDDADEDPTLIPPDGAPVDDLSAPLTGAQEGALEDAPADEPPSPDDGYQFEEDAPRDDVQAATVPGEQNGAAPDAPKKRGRKPKSAE